MYSCNSNNSGEKLQDFQHSYIKFNAYVIIKLTKNEVSPLVQSEQLCL